MAKDTTKTPSRNLSTGNIYLGNREVERIHHILTAQNIELTNQEVSRFMRLSAEEVEQRIFQAEFRIAAAAAFPEQVQDIEDLYQFALRIAQISRGENDLQPRDSVRLKLIQEAVEFRTSLQGQQSLEMEQQAPEQRITIVLRLASLIYYAVQDFAHELRLLAKQGTDSSPEAVVKALQVIIQDACRDADLSVAQGFEVARGKFGCRWLLRVKDEATERTLASRLLRRWAQETATTAI